MATLGYRLRIRTADNTADDLVVTSLDLDYLDSTVPVFTDAFESYADSAELEAAWPFSSAPDAPGVETSLDLTGGIGGSQALKFFMPAGSRGLGLVISPVPQVNYTISGLSPGTLYTISVLTKTDWDVTTSFDGRPSLRVVGGTGGPEDVFRQATAQAYGAWELLTVRDTAPISGELTVRLSMSNGALNFDRQAWFDSVIGSGPGLVSAHPYIAVPPQGDGQTLNPVTGEVQTGGFTIAVIDAEIAADTRVVTSKLADANGRNQLLSRRAYIEETEDGGTTWAVLMAGYVNSIRMVTAIRFEFTVGESRRVIQTTKVFQRAEPGFDRVSPILGGTLGDFGPYTDDGRPRWGVVEVSGDIVTLQWSGGNLLPAPIHENVPPIPDYNLKYINNQARHYIDTNNRIGGFPTCPGLTARLMDINTGPGLTSNPPAGFTEATADLMPLGFTFVPTVSFFAGGLSILTVDGRILLYWPASRGDQPTVGDRFKIIVFPREISDRNPLHWTGHPMDLATGLLALRGELYNAASAAAVKAELAGLTIEIRITAAWTLSDALEKIVYGPFGVAARTNDAGEQEFFTTRSDLPPPVDTLTNDDLFSPDGVAWATEEGSAINKVTFKTNLFTALPPGDPDPDPENPLDWIGVSDVTVIAVPDESEGAVFGDHTANYELPGNIVGMTTGSPEAPGALDDFVALIGSDLFDFQGRGAITSEVSTRRGVTGALIGETVTLDLAHLPTASPDQSPTSQRGTVPRIAVVLRRTPTPSGPILKLQDRGIAPSEQVGIIPEFTIEKSTADPRKIATVTITNGSALVTAGVKVRVQMATGSSTPTSGASVKLLDPAVDPLVFDLPPVCAGSKVWARMRSELTGFLPSDWSAFQGVQLDVLDPPTDLAGVFTGQTIALSWVLGANAADIPIEILLRETGDPDFVSMAMLPAGTLSYELTVPDPATEYDIGVRHHEAAPFDCVSAMATLDGVTSGTVEETPDPPVDDPNPPLPPVSDAGGGSLLVPFHTTLTHGAVLRYPPAETAEMAQYGRRRVDLSGFAKCQVQIHVRHPLPAGGTVSVQYVPALNTDPAEEDWLDLGTFGGPFVAADAATANPTVSPVMTIALLARQDVVLRPASKGGDGVTQFDTLEMLLYLTGIPANVDDGTVPGDPCEDSTVNFGGYEDVSDFDADWTTYVSTGEETTHTRSLDLTGGIDGSRALKLTIAPGSTYADGYVMCTLEISGLTPGGGANLYRMRAQVKSSANWEIPWPIYPNSGAPHVSLATVDGSYPENSVSATSASTGAWEEVTTDYIAANGSGILYAKCIADSPWIVPDEIYVLFDNVVVEHLDGTLISPCAGGPTQPGDGGYEPPDTGDPPPTPPGGSRLLYLIQYRQALWGTYPPFNGTVYTIHPADLLATLTAARSAGIGVFLDPVGTNRAKVNGVFNTQAYLDVLNTYDGLVDPADWFTEWGDVLREIRVIDEPNSVVHWGMAIQMSVVDGVLAKRCKEIFGDIPLQVSMRATAIEQSGLKPHYLQVVQMSYHRPRYGPIATFMAEQKAAAQRLGMQWAWGLNPENGGDGSSGITGSGGTGQWRMTPTEVRTYGLAEAADTASRSIAVWVSGSPPNTFLQTAAYVSAFTDVVAAL
jgi:hypothetical protein